MEELLGLLAEEARDGDVDEVIAGVRLNPQVTARARVNPEALNDDRGNTPLFSASRNGHLREEEYLLDEVHFSVDETVDFHLETALHQSYAYRLRVVQYRANGNARINKSRRTPLHFAALFGYVDVVRHLVEEGQANANAQNSESNTALDDAFSAHQVPVVRYLLPRTSCVSEETLVSLWKYNAFDEFRDVVLEKYAFGRGLESPFQRNPIQTILSEFPLPSSTAFQDAIKLFPPSTLSLPDHLGRLSIHVALKSRNTRINCPSLIAFLFKRQPRAVLARDPTTGFYPHETAASCIPARIAFLFERQKRPGFARDTTTYHLDPHETAASPSSSDSSDTSIDDDDSSDDEEAEASHNLTNDEDNSDDSTSDEEEDDAGDSGSDEDEDDSDDSTDIDEDDANDETVSDDEDDSDDNVGSNDNDHDAEEDATWLDIVYKMFRWNPQQSLQSRAKQQVVQSAN